MKIHNLILGPFLLLVIAANLNAASFDCSKAASEVEKTICGDDELSKLDESLNKAYLKALKRTDIKEQTIKRQRQWLENERNACHNAECVKKAYETRIKELDSQSSGASSSNTPVEVPKSQPIEPPKKAIPGKTTVISDAMAVGPSPKMSGDVSSPECSDAFQLAKFMFNSKSSRLYAPLSVPESMNSELVLGASARDISGGDALEVNKEQFEKVPHVGEHSIRSVYWRKHVEHGVRIAVKEKALGWWEICTHFISLNLMLSKMIF